MRSDPIQTSSRFVRTPTFAPRPRAFVFGLVTALFLTACTAAPQTTVTAPSTASAPPSSPTQPVDQAAALPTATPAAAAAAPAPSAPDLSAVAVNLEPLVENLAQPIFVTHAGDGSGRGEAGAAISGRTCRISNNRSAAPEAADNSPQTSLSWPRPAAANTA